MARVARTTRSATYGARAVTSDVAVTEGASMNTTSLIHSMVRDGRITPREAALLLEYRRLLAWKRRPWWERAAIVAWRAASEW